MPSGVSVNLVFPIGFTNRDASEAASRGYLSHVLVEVGDLLYPVFFYDPVRLRQDLEAYVENDSPFLAEPGMIVVPDVTLDAMKVAVERLQKEGFFEHLKPFTRVEVSEGIGVGWPPKRRSSGPPS
jgi:hypothetical protein